MKLEVGGLSHNLNGALGVGQARQLHLYLVVRLLADIGFGHAELVDAVADGSHHLFQGHFLGLLAGRVGQGQGIGAARSGIVFPHHGQVRVPCGQHFTKSVGLVRLGQYHFQAAVRIQTGLEQIDALPGGAVPHILAGNRQGILQGFFHIHAQGQIHAALKVQPQIDAGLGQQLAQRRVRHGGHVGQRVYNRRHQRHQGKDQTPTQSFHEQSLKMVESVNTAKTAARVPQERRGAAA